ncbi:class I SAM-dependent RNA methyltransferase [Saccharibacter sp. 17.LH.SD]|uniref:class I SAM-dependent RNA methyltransferase n=1 Tax=Saccharibacter sp. 17.LH.SD TaxID=2689393 RepID=UPI0013704E74|nr:class I SAM-dependent RNA methyltransferase [Saccharibacter sp. 17.LH.SD]MXV44606.1 class I SAM-dependent RNA methyltransferase [Saccharibacter sp. 17.LH.SD]
MEATSPLHHRLPVEGLGHSGDGFIRYQGRVVYIPGALPGEHVVLRLNGEQTDLLKHEVTSPVRVVPPCSLFGECGGCAMQHMALPAVLEWKVSRVRHALENAGFSSLPSPETFQAQPAHRQRVDLAIQRVPGSVVLGLHRRQGDPVDMTECTVLHPQIMGLLPPLREVLGSLGALTGRGALAINLFDSGPDLTLEIPGTLSSSDRGKLADFAKNQAIPRITWRPSATANVETVVQWSPVYHHFGEKRVSPPPASFLQATRDSEQAIVNAVLKKLPTLNRKDRIVELYAGCGTITFPMAEKGQVKAFEGNADAIKALNSATHGTRAEGFTRDLNRQPLLPHDLKNARVVVLDPPYNGAGKQISPLAQSDCRDIIYVSCNPTALTKDLTLLKKAGYEIFGWHVIDQFLWSGEVEAVIALSRDAKRLRKAKKKREE